MQGLRGDWTDDCSPQPAQKSGSDYGRLCLARNHYSIQLMVQDRHWLHLPLCLHPHCRDNSGSSLRLSKDHPVKLHLRRHGTTVMKFNLNVIGPKRVTETGGKRCTLTLPLADMSGSCWTGESPSIKVAKGSDTGCRGERMGSDSQLRGVSMF